MGGGNGLGERGMEVRKAGELGRVEVTEQWDDGCRCAAVAAGRCWRTYLGRPQGKTLCVGLMSLRIVFCLTPMRDRRG